MAGTVDKNGVLWKSTRVGSFVSTPAPGIDTAWAAICDAVEKYGQDPAVGWRPVKERHQVEGFEKLVLGDYQWMSYKDYFTRLENFGSGLASLGLAPGSNVVIYADTQYQWMLSAYGVWRQGMVVGTIYSTLGEEGAFYGMNQAQCPLVIADGKLAKVLARVAPKLKNLKHAVLFDVDQNREEVEMLKDAGVNVLSIDELEAIGREKPQKPTPPVTDDTAVLMYTSGTTGNPKGVLLSHRAIVAIMASTMAPGSALGGLIKQRPKYIAYLPLAHIMELAVECVLLYCGCSLGFGSPGTILPTSPKVLQMTPPQKGDGEALRPDVFVAAPAVLDRLYALVNGKIRAAPKVVQKLFACALASGASRFEAGKIGPNPCLGIIMKKVQRVLGGNVRVIVTGSAPLGPETQKFVQSCFACPVRQGYGLTETSAATCIQLLTDNSTSVVGPPQESACIRLRDWEEGGYYNSDLNKEGVRARRGEVLIGGPSIATAYLVDSKKPDPEVVKKNEEDFVDIDGIRYFCTGDIGQYTEFGNLKIIDRKKDLVKLQQGEYVALSKVENVLKASKHAEMYVETPMVYASSLKSFCIVLVCPQHPAIKALAKEKGIAGEISTLCKNKDITKVVLDDITAVCKAAKLAKFEVPAKVVLIDEPWTPDNGMLTAVMKLKRKEIFKRHQGDIESINYV